MSQTRLDPAAGSPLDPDALRYARYWEPVLAPAAHRVLDGISEPPSVVLDVGAGTGSLALEAAFRWPAARLIVLDASSAMLGVAQARVTERFGSTARFEWIAADARDVPLAGATVDAAVSSFALQRVDGGRGSWLHEIHRLLRPGGRFAFVTWLAHEQRMAADDAYAQTLLELGHEPEAAASRAPLEADYTSLDELRSDLFAVGFADVEVTAEELEGRWTVASYLELKEHYDDHERYDALEEAQRLQLRSRLRARLSILSDDAFVVCSPLAAGVARKAAP